MSKKQKNTSFKEDLKLKKFPEYENLKNFDSSFIPKFDQNGNITNHPIFDIFDHYEDVINDKFMILYFQMVVAAIYLEYKRLYKGLDVFIIYREKGLRSYQKNIDHALAKSEVNSIKDLKKDLYEDILGMKIVLNGLPDDLPFDSNNPENSTIFALNDTKRKNQIFSDDLKKWIDGYQNLLQNKETIYNYDGETYYNYKVQLLKCLVDCSYSKYSDDYEAKNPFVDMLNEAKYTQNQLQLSDNFPLEVSQKDIQELEDLRQKLIDRLNDKLENEIFKVTIPHILNSELIHNVLKISNCQNSSPNKFDGFSVKIKDGYSAWYWHLEGHIQTDAGIKNMQIELQTNTERSYEIGKLNHNNMQGKKVSIYDMFFELTDIDIPSSVIKDCKQLLSSDAENLNKFNQDLEYRKKFLLNYYLNKLNNIKDIVPYSTDIKYKKQRENVEEYKRHIKLKNNISIGGESFSVTEYLKMLLPYISANLYSTNAAHDTSVSAVILNKKNQSSNLADVLRKSDGTSVLAHWLIDLLRQEERNQGISLHDNSNYKDEYTIFSEGISELDIRNFAAKYSNMLCDFEQSKHIH